MSMDKIQGLSLQEFIDALQKIKDSGVNGRVIALSNDGYLGGNITDVTYGEDKDGNPEDIIIDVNIDYPFTLQELVRFSRLLKDVALLNERVRDCELFKNVNNKINGAIEYAEAVVEED